MVRAGRTLLLIALVGMLHWLFGNLYEEVVIAPNWLVSSQEQLHRLHALFVRTSPTTYFVPVSFVAPALTWVAQAICRRTPARGDLRRASLFALLATVVNAVIVGSIVTQLFGDGYSRLSEAVVHDLCVRWNALNGVRMIFTASTAYWLFAAFRRLDHSDALHGSCDRTMRAESASTTISGRPSPR